MAPGLRFSLHPSPANPVSNYGGEKPVSELVRRVGLSHSALSQHLARLRRDELVQTRREAQTIYYSLAGHRARAVIETLARLYDGDGGDRAAREGGG